jgi:prepilin-type N-terminal cleavage/methylation domain-containing protein
MMMRVDHHGRAPQAGFTLLEIIVTIMLMGVLGTLAVQFMATALEDSARPIDHVQAESGRVSIMEKIISDYVFAVNGGSPTTALTTVKTNVDGGIYNAGTTTVTAAWIAFDSAGQETAVSPGPGDNLKVSVTTDAAALVAILSNSRTDTTDPKVAF